MRQLNKWRVWNAYASRFEVSISALIWWWHTNSRKMSAYQKHNDLQYGICVHASCERQFLWADFTSTLATVVDDDYYLCVSAHKVMPSECRFPIIQKSNRQKLYSRMVALNIWDIGLHQAHDDTYKKNWKSLNISEIICPGSHQISQTITINHTYESTQKANPLYLHSMLPANDGKIKLDDLLNALQPITKQNKTLIYLSPAHVLALFTPLTFPFGLPKES